MARIRALTAYFEVTAIELTSFERMYRWPRKDHDGSVQTLRHGTWEDQNQLLVAIVLWKKLNAIKPQIVLVPGYATLPAVCAAVWGRVHAAETVLMSESNFADHPRSALGETVKKVLLNLLFTSAVVGGRRASSYLHLLGMAGRRIGNKYDVVDNEYFSVRAAQLHSCSGERHRILPSPFFLYVGRLAPEKNITVLLSAFTRYRVCGGTWPLVIVGDGPLASHLREEAEKHDVHGAITFVGHKSIEDLPLFYADAGCFVLPSTR